MHTKQTAAPGPFPSLRGSSPPLNLGITAVDIYFHDSDFVLRGPVAHLFLIGFPLVGRAFGMMHFTREPAIFEDTLDHD